MFEFEQQDDGWCIAYKAASVAHEVSAHSDRPIYWTGGEWSKSLDDALRFPSRDEAQSYTETNKTTLEAALS